MSNDDVVEVSPGPAHRRGRWPAVAFVLVLALAVGGVVAWLATRGGPATGSAGTEVHPGAVATVACPTALTPGSVPEPPAAAGVDGRLVPDRAPVSVVVCEYGRGSVAPAGPAAVGSGIAAGAGTAPEAGSSPSPTDPATTSPDSPTASGSTPSGSPLARSTALAGNDPALTDLVAALRSAPTGGTVACGGIPGGADAGAVLVGLRYDDGTVWVTAVGACEGSTNGTTRSTLALAPLVAAVLDAGASTTDPSTPSGGPASPDPGVSTPFPGEPADPAPSGVGVAPVEPDPFAACASPTPPDRTSLVPFTPVAVRICHVPVSSSVAATTTVDRPTDVANRLVSALADLPVLEPDIPCAAIGGEQWGLLFSADDGRTAAVRVDAGGCGTASNGVRTVRSDPSLLAALGAAAG